MGKAEWGSRTEKETWRAVLRVGRGRGRTVDHCFKGCSESARPRSRLSFLVQHSVSERASSPGNGGPRWCAQIEGFLLLTPI